MQRIRFIIVFSSLAVVFSACTSLFDAAKKGDTNAVQALLEKGADINAKDEEGKTALMYAVEGGHSETVRLLKRAEAAKRKERKLSKKQSVKTAHIYNFRRQKKYISALTGINRVLMAAVETGNAANVLKLLNKGADANAKNDEGVTALMKAAGKGHKDVVVVLLDKGADVDAKDGHGGTALMDAAIEGDADIVRTLLENGADVNIKDMDGITAIMCVEDNISVVQVLLDKGADVNVKDKFGLTALKRAEMAGNFEKAGLLRQVGAKE
jgi:ankyrin repeat protein